MLYLANNRLLLINNGNSLYRIDSQTQPEPDSNSFKFTIDTTLGAGDSFDLPLRSGYNYDFVVDWGDGNTNTVTSFDDVNKTHTYATGGEYQISITGLCESWYFNYTGDRLKLTSIEQWGGTGFKNMQNAFVGCSNLTSSTDSDGSWCSGVTNMNAMFFICSSLTTLDVSNWDTSSVTNMNTMFYNCILLTTLDVSNWDTSSVTSMNTMFFNCSSLTTLDVSNWNISSVTDMGSMFNTCSSLTTLDVSNWDTSSVTNMSYMFRDCSSLTTLDVSNWDIISIQTYTIQNPHSMNQMFTNCPLSTESYDAALISWSQQNVKEGVMLDADLTQYSCDAKESRDYLINNKGWIINDLGLNVSSCDEPINEPFIFTIDTTKGSGSSFTLPLRSGYNYNFVVDWGDGSSSEITSYNDSNRIHNYSSGGTYQISINGTCESWYFNYGGDRLKLISIEQWGRTGFKNMEYAFNGCSNLTGSTDSDGSWCSSVTNMIRMFYYCTSLTTLDVSNWDVSNVTNMSAMFYNCSSLTTLDVSNWDTSSVTSMNTMFFNCSSLTTLDVSNWDVSNVTNMESMFYSCSLLTTLDVSNWDTSSVTDMSRMFDNCSSLTTLDVSNWDTSSVSNMSNMFRGCSSLTTLDVSSWDTSSVTNMSYMFNACSSLATLDVSNWNVSNVTDMSYMFNRCSSLTTLDVSNWDVSNVTNMSYMFYYCTSLTTLDVSNWNVSNVTNMSYMFDICSSLTTLDVSNWNVSNVTNMSYMFRDCTSLTTLDVSNWDITSIQTYINTSNSMNQMFTGCPLSTESYDGALISWSQQNVKTGVRLDANLAKYSAGAAATAREILTSTPNNWTIYDGGQVI